MKLKNPSAGIYVGPKPPPHDPRDEWQCIDCGSSNVTEDDDGAVTCVDCGWVGELDDDGLIWRAC